MVLTSLDYIGQVQYFLCLTHTDARYNLRIAVMHCSRAVQDPNVVVGGPRMLGSHTYILPTVTTKLTELTDCYY